MHIQFMIERVIYPKTLAEWRDYVIAEVKVLYCSAPHANLKGTIQKFKGKLPRYVSFPLSTLRAF